VNICIFASGTGSNAVRIIEHFQGNDEINVQALFCNKPNAPVLEKVQALNIPTHTFSREDLNGGTVLGLLQRHECDLIVLAGFLWLMPADIVNAIPTLNIHPALLPKFGGKGMYGPAVHQAVKDAGESESGMTIHWVNANYDEGSIIHQSTVSLDPNDSAQDIEDKVRELELSDYPLVIEQTAQTLQQ
jgi:phosphoribosylglycinamide formyltransferase-1